MSGVRAIRARLVIVSLCCVLSVACSRDADLLKREHLRSGDAFASRGRTNEAIIEYRNAAQIDARYGEARYKLAALLLKTGDVPGAAREYVRAADLLPGNLDAQVKAGELLYLSGQLVDAGARADKALAIDRNSIDALILKGNTLAGLKDLDGALRGIQRAIELDPERATSYASLGFIQATRGSLPEAERAFRRAAEVNPKSIEARLALANFYWTVRRSAEAETALKDALAHAPRAPLVNRALALFYIVSDRPRQAEPHLRVLIEDTNDVKAAITLAELYAATGRFSHAKAELRRVARTDTNHFVLAQSRLALLLLREGENTAAHKTVAAAIAREPRNPVGHMTGAELLLAERQLDEALKSAQAAVQADPSSAAALFVLGRIRVARNEPEEAEKTFRDVVRLAPTLVPAQLQLARISLAVHRPDQALTYAQEVLKAQPDHAEAELLRARALMNMGNASAAEPMLKLARRYPDVAAVQAQLGTLHLIRNDLPAAREAFGRALSADANQLEALTGLVDADLRDKRSASARARVGAALARREDSPELLVLAGKTAAATGDLPEAETYFRRAIEMDPSTLEAYSMLGRMFVAQKRLTDAMREFEAAAARRPTSVSAQTMVAMLLEVQGRRAEARKGYLRILEIDPRAAVAANNLAWQMAEAGENLDLALQYSQTAKAALPDRPEINDTLGWIYYKKGLTSLAIGSLRESVEKAPQNPLFHYHLGMAYAKHGDTRSARRALEQALAMSGSFPGADEARRALGELKS